MMQLMPWAMGNQADLIACSGTNGSGNNARMMVQPVTETFTPVLFPNPVSHDNAAMTLQFGAVPAGEIHLGMRNALGQMVAEKIEQVSEGQTTLVFDPGQLSSGVYFLTVKYNGNLSTHRIVVE
jgi:hypothetical protein